MSVLIVWYCSGETRQSAAPGRQFAAPYRVLVNSRFLRRTFFFPFFFLCSPLFFAAPGGIFAAPKIFCPSAVAKSDGFMLLYNFLSVDRRSIGHRFSNFLTNLQNAAPQGCRPPLARSAGPVVTPQWCCMQKISAGFQVR